MMFAPDLVTAHTQICAAAVRQGALIWEHNLRSASALWRMSHAWLEGGQDADASAPPRAAAPAAKARKGAGKSARKPAARKTAARKTATGKPVARKAAARTAKTPANSSKPAKQPISPEQPDVSVVAARPAVTSAGTAPETAPQTGPAQDATSERRRHREPSAPPPLPDRAR